MVSLDASVDENAERQRDSNIRITRLPTIYNLILVALWTGHRYGQGSGVPSKLHLGIGHEGAGMIS